MKKWLRRLGKLCAWFLLILVFLLIEENIRGRLLVATYKHHLRAQGKKLTLAELGLINAPAPPDAATVDLLAAAKTLPEWNYRFAPEYLRFMRPVISGAATFSWQVPIINDVPSTWPAVVAQLNSNAPALSAAMDALGRNPHGVPYGFVHDPVFAETDRHRLLYWLMWATANNLREGKLDEAGETILAMERLGRTFQSNHPAYYRQFMQHGLNATWELLQCGATNVQQLSALQDIWSNATIVPDLAKAYEAYHAWNLEHVEALTWGTTNDNAWVLQLFPPTSRALWFLGGRYFDEYGVLLISQHRLNLTRSIAESRRWSSWHGESWPKQLWWCLPWSEIMPFALNEDWYFSEHMLRTVEFETHREMTVAAIALQRYRLRHRQWPETLNDLVPEFLTELPRDWMDGQPLRYRRNSNDTFTLYSVGEDLRDDGGDLTPIDNSNFDVYPLAMWRTRDAVWPVVATKENIDELKKAAKDKKQPPPRNEW
jgi:hypothetical protein